jgi:hypothetical protein
LRHIGKGDQFGFFLAMGFELFVSGVSIESSQGGSPALPSQLDSYLSTTVRPTAADLKLMAPGNLTVGEPHAF